MSKFLKPTIYKSRALETQWLNNTVQAHDMICSCDTPFDHLIHLIKQQKCVHTSEKGTTTEEPTGITHTKEDTFDAGDLEKLFEQDMEENDG